MKLSFTPELDTYEKETLRTFLTTALAHKLFEGRWPLPNYRLSINIDNRAHLLSTGNWYKGNGALSLARSTDVETFPLSLRLSVLLTLSQLCESSEALTAASSTAIGRVLLGQFNEFNGNLVVGARESKGIAFSTDNRIASLIGSEWMLPSGEVVDVSEGWTVCAAELPVSVVVETAPLAGAPIFAVGQRVRYSQIVSTNLPAGEGTLIRSNGIDGWDIKFDDGDVWFVETSALSPLTPTRPFAVGDRVRYTRIPHVTEEPGEGVVVMAECDEEGNRPTSQINSDRHGEFYVFTSDLTLIEDVPF